MRSSKSRSRSKSNRSRSMGNVVNRVFESSGPEGKVRGTPQQVIDKYTQLARDAQLNNDRVATESFQQHAEHYTRMLGEAQREAEARRESQDGGGRDRGDEGKQANGADREAEPGPDEGKANGADAAPAAAKPETEVTETDGGTEGESTGQEAESGLVETPESKPAPKKRARKPKAKASTTPPAETGADSATSSESDGASGNGSEGEDPSSTAAE